MAARTVSKPAAGIFGEFERLCDELFDEHLISPWRTHRHEARSSEHALLLDHGARYEIRMAAPAADPHQIEIEVTERRLSVHVPGLFGAGDSFFDFPHPVDCDAVSARWSAGVLQIVLPKKQGRRIGIQ